VRRITEQDIRVRRCYSRVHAQPCFHGYCLHCRKTLTAFDDSPESCRRIAAGKPYHVCEKAA